MTQAETEPDVLHAEAIKTMLAPTGFPVYIGASEIPDNPPWPYLVAWAAAGEPPPSDERLRGYAGNIITRHQITIAGLSELQVIGAAARVRNLLHRKHPTITGRVCGDITQDPGPPPTPIVDTTVVGPRGQRVFITYLFFTLLSTPTPTT